MIAPLLGQLTADLGHGGAMMPATVISLREADAYCWSPMCVEAVASAAAGLPPEAALSVDAVAALGGAGWWWFEEPVPIQTLAKPDPVCALVWRVERLPGRPATLWVSTFVSEAVTYRGRPEEIPVPSTAFVWRDGMTLADFAAYARDEYAKIPEGEQASGREVTLGATMWFARFVLAATTWLTQRIMGVEKGQGTRQVARQIQREHKLAAMPTVRVVHLRRRETVHRAPVEGEAAPGVKREWTCRWVVRGFWRNQWYPSTNEHRLKYIDAFVKGPDDKPLKERERIYAVER
jgi:hypothetical protein